MKNLLLTPMTGYLMLGKIFSSKIASRTLRQCLRHYSKNSNLFKPRLLDVPRILNRSKELSFHAKNYCVSQDRTFLMDFPLAFTPHPLNTMRMVFLKYFVLHKLDAAFQMQDFVNHTKFALEVVSNLLSELRFEQLDQLMTKECKDEVERNARALKPSQRMGLAIKANHIYYSFPFDLNIIDDGEKKFIQILVVHHVYKDFDIIIKKPFPGPMLRNNLELFTVYNCRFIKEVTEDDNDQWTINAINLCKLHEDVNYRNHFN